MSVHAKRLKVVWLCLSAAVVLGQTQARADDQQLMDRIKVLEDKIAVLEGKSTQTVTQASIPQKTLDFLGQTEISGFVSASYIYDFSRGAKSSATPGSPTIGGRLFDSNNNSFTLDKFKLAVEHPIDYSPTNWLAGYRADLIVGQDAPLTHSSGLFGGPGSSQDIDLEQAFVDVNIPIGNGLKVIAGKTVTLMGVEVIEEVANPNWSEGNQFIYVENFTQTGIQLAYKWNDKIDTELVVFNGWDQLPDNNSSPSFMGRIGIAPDPNTTIGLLGYGGCETLVDNHDYRTGAEIVLNRNKLFTDKLNAWLQFDYGHEDNAPAADLSGATPAVFPNADWYAAGAWATYDFTDKVELALRADYLKDKEGVRTPFVDGSVTAPGEFSVAPKELYSLTATLNIKPINNLQVRPEVRFDHSAASQAFDGKDDQVTALIGVAYLY